MIVEVEAYIGEDDPACHAAPGPTARNAPLYGPPGRAYVYLNYGIHSLVNAVTEAAGSPAAVLIRALAPLEGLDLMRRRRGVSEEASLCRGPGNLTVALGIGLRQNNADLTSGALVIEDHAMRPPAISWSPRIGIRVGTEVHWRAYWEGRARRTWRVQRFGVQRFKAQRFRVRRGFVRGARSCQASARNW